MGDRVVLYAFISLISFLGFVFEEGTFWSEHFSVDHPALGKLNISRGFCLFSVSLA